MPSVRHIASTKLPNKKEKYTIVIPAAGQGSRMLTYGPKSMIKLNNNATVLSRQIEMIDKIVNIYDIILVIGFQADKIRNKIPDYLTCIINQDYEKNNVVASIGLGLAKVKTDKVIVMYGDLVFNQAMLEAPMSYESMLLLGNMKTDEIGCTIDNNYVKQLCYDLPNKWAQIMFLTGKELELISSLSREPINKNMYGFEIINEAINKGGKFKAFAPKNGKIIDIDSSKDIIAAKRI